MITTKLQGGQLRKFILIIWIVTLTILGLVLIFNEPIKDYTIEHMQNSALNSPIKNKPKSGQFDIGKVKEVKSKDIVNAAVQSSDNSIGKISIPSVGLRLPIFYGMANDNMVRGACTMRPDEKMGMKGNYCLAGHHMMDSQILFGPLEHVKAGDKIYLTDGEKTYVYRVDDTKVVSKYETIWLQNTNQGNVLTLITCASGKKGETKRIVVRGSLISIDKYNPQPFKNN